MPERDRPAHFPPVPELYPRPADVIPADTGAPAQLEQQEITSPEPSAPRLPAPPVDAGGHPVPSPEGQQGGEAAGAVSQPAMTEMPTISETTRTPEQQRVVLTGRVGRDPTVWTTKGGTLRAKFPLGSKDDPDSAKTAWRDIQFWARRAERVRDTVRKGQLLEVVAYRRLVEVQTPRGTRRVEEFRGSVVKHRS